MMRIWKYLTSTWISIICLIVLCICCVLMCAIELHSCAFDMVGESEGATEGVNPAGIDASVDEELDNSINLSQFPDSSFIYDISIEELAQADSYLDGQTVQVVGQVVGDRIIDSDPDYCWILLQSVDGSDDELTLYMPTSSTALIDTYGAYGRLGTQLQARGTFNLACRDHQGASDMHVTDVTVMEKGRIEEVPLEPKKALLGLGLIALGCALALLYNALRERQR